jgi:archaetidylinositol phosphate synthase
MTVHFTSPARRLSPNELQERTLKPAQRIQQNMLAIAERRLLTWLAARMPSWVTPDRLTSLGFVGAAAVGAGYALSAFHPAWLWLSIASFFINWFGDSLDGSLARFRKIERPRFGYFIDHSMDSLGNMIIMLGVGLSPFVRLDVAMFGLAGYLLLSIHTFIAARVVDEFRLSYMAGGPTELRIVLIVMSLCMLTFGDSAIVGSLTPFDLFVGTLGSVLVCLFVVQTFSTGRRLRRRGE